MYKITLYASNNAGTRFRLVWLVDGFNEQSCKEYVETLLDADTKSSYFNKDWHVEAVKGGVYSLVAVQVPAPHLMPGVVSGDGENGV